MIDTVIAHHLPDYWDKVTYPGRYLLITLTSSASDYYTVVDLFEGKKISKVQRIQNPYMYGRYKLQEEKLHITKPGLRKQTLYHPISVLDVETVAEYNCDHRRYKNGSHYQCSGKNPRFYTSPEDVYFPQFPKDWAYLVVESHSLSPDRDSEYYPAYVVFLNN